MATSGTVTFRLDVEDLIDEALERCGVDVQSVTGSAAKSARRSLNLMFSEWSVRGVNYWKVEKVSLPLVQGTEAYTLPAGTLDVIDASVQRSGSDTTLTRMALTDYQGLPDKTTQGRPSQFFLDRKYTPVMYLWQVPENSTDTIEYWRLVQMEDIDASNQDIDAPYRWSEALCAGLAAKLALKVAVDREARLSQLAEVAFTLAASDESERAGLRIIPTGVVF